MKLIYYLLAQAIIENSYRQVMDSLIG